MHLSYSVPSVSSGREDIGAAEAVPEILAAVTEPGGEGGAQQQLRCREHHRDLENIFVVNRQTIWD